MRKSLLAGAILSVASFIGACQKDVGPVQEYIAPVKVMTVEPRDIVLRSEFTGEVSSSQQVELRARVSGVLEQKHFADGTQVERGQLLYSIDDRDFKARLLEAKAALSTAQSDYTRAKLDVDRYEPLLKTQAIARQVYDNAVATMKAASSTIENTRAAVEQAELAVEYASILSPVSGRIGASAVQVGDLISAGTTLLAEVSTVETSWVYFSVSEPDLLAYERTHGIVDLKDYGKDAAELSVQLILSDGSIYEHSGQINFADRALNPSTGTYRLRAEFPNPNGMLRPGMFARIRAAKELRKDAIAIPDKAISQLLNSYSVSIVDEGNIAKQVAVKVGPRQDGLWIIEEGLSAGDRLIVEGFQKARNGVKVEITENLDEKNTSAAN
ncbi:MAG: efflux RND transporter periplasmic adaptor subunit [Parahaliea sp.]